MNMSPPGSFAPGGRNVRGTFIPGTIAFFILGSVYHFMLYVGKGLEWPGETLRNEAFTLVAFQSDFFARSQRECFNIDMSIITGRDLER